MKIAVTTYRISSNNFRNLLRLVEGNAGQRERTLGWY